MGKWVKEFEIYDCENKEKVDLSSSSLTKVPKFINCENLKELYLSYNQINKIENLDKLINLKGLYLFDNPLKFISNKNFYKTRDWYKSDYDNLKNDITWQQILKELN